tara:strand:- start:11463 stop:11921 length:459 start_codon:yes stop_codon:yes gene_type:complete
LGREDHSKEGSLSDEIKVNFEVGLTPEQDKHFKARTRGRMRVHIREDARKNYIAHAVCPPAKGVVLSYADNLGLVEDQWLEVDTTHLFLTQYNCHGTTLRIYNRDIDAIEDDARVDMARCNYCGATTPDTDDPCDGCGKNNRQSFSTRWIPS